MKEFKKAMEAIAGIMLVLFAGAILTPEPTAAAIFIATSCWLIFKD